MLRPDPEVFRFLLSSSAHFVGEAEGGCYLLSHAFPEMNNGTAKAHRHEGPYHRSFLSLSLRIDTGDSDSKARVIPSFNFIADDVSSILSAFFGKIVENHGHTQFGDTFCVPNLIISPILNFTSPPFNSKPRAATQIDLNVDNAKEVLEIVLDVESRSATDISIIRGATFYRAALRQYGNDPIIAFTLLLSSLEALIPVFPFTEEEILDEKLKEILQTIEDAIDDSERIVRNIKQRLFQVRRKCELVVERLLDDQFFVHPECSRKHFCIAQDDVGKRIKAAYDLRSRFLHTGESHGSWVSAFEHTNAEKIVGDPVISSKDLKRLVKSAPTIIGLERIVQYCLCKLIRTHLGKTEGNKAE